MPSRFFSSLDKTRKGGIALECEGVSDDDLNILYASIILEDLEIARRLVGSSGSTLKGDKFFDLPISVGIARLAAISKQTNAVPYYEHFNPQSACHFYAGSNREAALRKVAGVFGVSHKTEQVHQELVSCYDSRSNSPAYTSPADLSDEE